MKRMNKLYDGTLCAVKIARTMWDGEKLEITSRDYLSLSLVEHHLLTNFRDTAKEVHTKQNAFIAFLLKKKYLYHGKTGKLPPYQKHVDNGLFEIKEVANGENGWAGVQTFITLKGRETFRLLLTV